MTDHPGSRNVLLVMSEAILGFTLIELTLFLIPASWALATRSTRPANLVVPLTISPADLFFVVALIALVLALWHFPRMVLPFACERASDHLVTFFFSLVLLCVGYFSLLFPPYRFLFVGLILGLAWYKDRVLYYRYRKTAYKNRIGEWHRRMRWTCLGTLAGGGLFLLLTHSALRRAVLDIIIEGDFRLKPSYDFWVFLVFHLVFMAIALRSLYVTHEYFEEWGEKDKSALQSLGQRTKRRTG